MNEASVSKQTFSLFFVSCLALSLAGCGGGGGSGNNGLPNGPDDGAGNNPEMTALADLKEGDCASPLDNGRFVSALSVTDCSEPHDVEVAGRFEFSEADDVAYPGHLAIQQKAYEQCQPVLESSTGVPFWDSQYDIETITPSASTWADGDRSAICLIVTMDDTPLTAPAGAPAMARFGR